MKKDNNLVKFTIFILLITIVAISLVSGTFAKYTSEFNGSDTAVVAKWDVSDGDAFATFDIFDVSKIYDTKDVTDFTAAGIKDTDVDAGVTHGIIAPGTWGKFSYTLTNASEVNATYAVEYEVDEKGVYLQWSTNGTDWTDSLADITATSIDASVNNVIYWKWAYEAEQTPVAVGQSDENDTTLGEAETLASPTISVKVTVTQAD